MKTRRTPPAPWMKFDTDAWLASAAIGAMTCEQEGAYIHLLAHAWHQEPPCTLPVDDAQLAQLSRLGSRWKKHGGIVKAQFEIVEVPDVGPRLRNARQWREYVDISAAHERRVEAGRRGGNAAKKSRQDDAGDDDTGSNATSIATSIASPMPPALPPSLPHQEVESCKTKISSGRVRDGGKAADRDVIPIRNWPARFAQAWTRGVISPAMIGRLLKPLIDLHGEDAVFTAWTTFVASDKAEYGPGYFVRNYETFAAKQPTAPSKAEEVWQVLLQRGLVSADGERYRREIDAMADAGDIDRSEYMAVGAVLRRLQATRTPADAIRIIDAALSGHGKAVGQ